MSQVAKWTYQDSRTMRIATLIAMVYLPVNLVLVRQRSDFIIHPSQT